VNASSRAWKAFLPQLLLCGLLLISGVAWGQSSKPPGITAAQVPAAVAGQAITPSSIGAPTATTQAAGDDSTKVGTTAYTDGAITTLKSATNSWSGTQTFASVIGTIRTQSATTDTLSATDCGATVNYTATSAVTVTLPNSFSPGCNVALVEGGTAKVSVTAASGGSIVSPHSFTGTYAAGSVIMVSVISNAGSAAKYLFSGDGS
jgi:hypothetical protein